MTRDDRDVIIIGGGPAGCATALALVHQGVKGVCIIDAPPTYRGPRVGESVPPDILPLLETLGARDAFEADAHEPCLGSCSSWGNADLGFNDSIYDPRGNGWHLDRTLFDRTLVDLTRSHGVRVVEGKLLGVDLPSDSLASLKVESRRAGVINISARFVVDASGSRGSFARRISVSRLSLDQLTCFYTFFDASNASSSLRLTMAEAVSDGWWYAAAVPDDMIAVAFFTDPTMARQLRPDNPVRWLSHMLRTHHIAPRLNGCRFRPETMVARAAQIARLERASGKRWLAVGDAAASYDPLSSQGIYKALEDGLRAADALVVALTDDSDLSPEYDTVTQAQFDDHRISRDYFYQLEQRWPNAPFWKRRYAADSLERVA